VPSDGALCCLSTPLILSTLAAHELQTLQGYLGDVPPVRHHEMRRASMRAECSSERCRIEVSIDVHLLCAIVSVLLPCALLACGLITCSLG
jgi:hypothetical protein